MRTSKIQTGSSRRTLEEETWKRIILIIMTQNKPIKVGKGVEKRKDAGALPTKVYSLSISD